MRKDVLCFLLIIFTFGCQKEINPDISFLSDNADITLDAYANSKAIFSFSSTQSWQASTESDWLNISPASGDAGIQNMTITAISGNNSDTIRTATITLSSFSLTYELKINQLSDDYIVLEQDSFFISSEGEKLQIHFSTNIDSDELKIYSSANWLVQDNELTRSSDSYVINLTVLPNTEEDSRMTCIYFYKNTYRENVLLNSLTIIQDGAFTVISTDYSSDKNVRKLKSSSLGCGIPIVIMGDGFTDTEVASGNYDKVMEKAMENIFSEEPLKSLYDYFDVYSVTAISRKKNFNGYDTVFECFFEGGTSTGIYGNDEKVMEYVQCVDDIELEEALAVVIINSSTYAGTTYFGYGNETDLYEFAIAYCPIIYDLDNESFRQVLVHEAVGHGFAKLEDEYSYQENGSMPNNEIDIVKYLQTFDWAQNVDFTDNEDDVLWADFLKDERYKSENIGVYEGACTYMTGVYRSTEESMMNSNTTGFNAPSRRAIYNMVMKRGKSIEPTYEDFVAFDIPNQVQSMNISRVSGSDMIPFARPRFVNKYIDIQK